MSRDFVLANTEYFTTTTLGSLPTSVPLTMACWFSCDIALASNLPCQLMGVYDASVANHWFEIVAGDNNDARFNCYARASTSAQSLTTNTISQSVWHHGCGIFTSSTSRRGVLDGDWANSNENTTNVTPANLDTFRIGYRGDSNPNIQMDGRIADAAVWTAALDQQEVEALAAGCPPYLIRPGSLVAYWPLRESSGNALDIIGGHTLTDTNTVGTSTEHGRTIHAGAPIFVRTLAAAPVTGGYTGALMSMGLGV